MKMAIKMPDSPKTIPTSTARLSVDYSLNSQAPSYHKSTREPPPLTSQGLFKVAHLRERTSPCIGVRGRPFDCAALGMTGGAPNDEVQFMDNGKALSACKRKRSAVVALQRTVCLGANCEQVVKNRLSPCYISVKRGVAAEASKDTPRPNCDILHIEWFTWQSTWKWPHTPAAVCSETRFLSRARCSWPLPCI